MSLDIITPATAIVVTPTVQAAAYASGNVIGGLLTLNGASRNAAFGGLIQSATAAFVSGVTPALDLVLFNANPSGSTITDKTALAVATADVGKVVGVVHLTDTTLLGASAPSVVQGLAQAMPYMTVGTALYACVVARGAATLTSTSDMTLTVNLLQN